jgi:predicted PurR-regulated permease PerM
MYAVVTGYVTGQLTVSAIGAAAAALAVFILSLIFPVIPGNLAFPTAAITFVLSLIPMFGATIGGVLVALLLAFNNLPAGIIYIIYFIIYQQVENNFISPHIQAKKIDLSALAVLASVTIGIYVFGVVGGIIAIPIAGCIRVLIEEYMTKAARKREEEIDHHHKGFLGKLIEKYQASHEAKEAEKEA